MKIWAVTRCNSTRNGKEPADFSGALQRSVLPLPPASFWRSARLHTGNRWIFEGQHKRVFVIAVGHTRKVDLLPHLDFVERLRGQRLRKFERSVSLCRILDAEHHLGWVIRRIH